MTQITVAALQLGFTDNIDTNIANVSRLVREAAARGAQVILPPELFEGEYFCRVEDEGLFANARAPGEHQAGICCDMQWKLPPPVRMWSARWPTAIRSGNSAWIEATAASSFSAP